MKRHKGEQSHGGDIYRNQGLLDFSINVNPLGPPQRVKEAIRDKIEEISVYPDVFCESLCEKIAEYEEVNPDFLVCGSGASELIYGFVQGLRPKSGLILAPTFSEYQRALESVNAEVIPYYLKEGFRIEEDILELFPNVEVVFLCNPNNPTGQLIEKEMLLQIIQACERQGIYLVLDECFLDFVEEKEAYECIPYCKDFSYLFVLKAFTKLFGMAGLRLGYGISSNFALLEKICKSIQPWNVSGMAQVAGIAALQDREAYLKQTRILLAKEKESLQHALEEAGYRVFDSKANYLFFQAEKGFYEKAKEGGFLIRDCKNYLGLEEGFYRIGIRTEEENERIIQWLKKL